MLTFWALSLVCLRPMYGLEIKNEIESSSQGKIRLGASTIYQLLRRLEARQLVVGHWESTPRDRRAPTMQPTQAGRTLVALCK